MNYKTLSVGLAVIVVFLFVVGGYALAMKQLPSKNEQTQAAQSDGGSAVATGSGDHAVSQSTPDNSGDFKTYHGANFEFSYPANLSIVDQNDGGDVNSDVVVLLRDSTRGNAEGDNYYILVTKDMASACGANNISSNKEMYDTGWQGSMVSDARSVCYLNRKLALEVSLGSKTLGDKIFASFK